MNDTPKMLNERFVGGKPNCKHDYGNASINKIGEDQGKHKVKIIETCKWCSRQKIQIWLTSRLYTVD